jgi:hypothetical protein
MSRRIVKPLFIISVISLVLYSCAKISAPTGGPRDRKPPVVVTSKPLNGSKNFKGKNIEITFDEYVVLDNINEKFMLSPPVKKKPRVFIRGKNVNVEFEDKLKDSTTYTLYFQDAIKDLNEGNILQNYQFVMATGPVIDSLSVTGNIYNATDLEVPEKTIALMYSEMADSAVKKHLPAYITRLDQTGYFRIDNVRPGTYRLFGLKDADNSKNYNLPDEEFAFMDSTITVTTEKNYIPPPVVVKDTIVIKKTATKPGQGVKDSTKIKKDAKVVEPPILKGQYKLLQFQATKKAHYLASSRRDQKYQLIYALSLPPDTMKLELRIPGADTKSYFTEPSIHRDTLKVWISDSTLYSTTEISTIVKYPFTDSLGVTGYKQDTIPLRFQAVKPSKNQKIKRTVLSVENNISSGFLKPGQSIVFRSKTPLQRPDTSKIRLYEILQTSRQKVPFSFVKDSVNSTKYYLNTRLEQGKRYMFVAKAKSFVNIFREYTDSVGIKFSIKDPETYCKLTLDVKNYEGDRIIQLLDKSEKFLAEHYMSKDGKTVFPLLDPGTYRVRVIYDLNGDRKWTTGDFDKKRQPEPVSYYPDEIELRPGFELDQAWDIGLKNQKDQKLREKKKK